MDMKAVIVAGGHGSRLLPFTRYTHKTLLPLHRRPVIDYALATIRRAGINDITIIGNQFIGQIAQHVGTGLPGENIHYVIEEEPKGVQHALNLARPHVEGSRVLIYFSDNITTIEFTDAVNEFQKSQEPPGCRLVGREVEDPERFGVAVFDEDGNLTDIVEKPEHPPSSFAIGGIYLFDETFWTRLDNAVGNNEGGVSITDVNKTYVAEGKAKIIDWPDSLWIDCGTPDALLEAAK